MTVYIYTVYTVYIYIYIYIYIYHYVALPPRISLTLSLQPSLSSITPGRSSRLYPVSTELLYIGSSWSSCLCSSMWRCPLEYIAYEFVLTSPAMSCMSGSSNLEFSWWVIGDRTTAVLWGVASRICSILFAAFLCNCCQVFSPYV